MRAGLGEQEKGVLGSLRTAANDSELLSTPEVAGLAYSPAICHTGEDYIFAWVKHLPGEKRDELHVGAPGGDSRVVSASSAVLWPALALLTHNTLLISWIDGDNFEVRAQLLGSNLEPIGTEHVLNRTGTRSSALKLTACDSGAWIAWESWNQQAASQIHMRFWSMDKGIGPVVEASPSDVSAYWPSVATSGPNLLCAWTALNAARDGYDVMLSLMSEADPTEVECFQLSSDMDGNFHLYPNMLVDEYGSFWITWTANTDKEHYDYTSLPGNSDFAYLQTDEYRRKRNVWWKAFRPVVARLEPLGKTVALEFMGDGNEAFVESIGYCHFPTLVPGKDGIPGLLARRLTEQLLFEIVHCSFQEGWQEPVSLTPSNHQTGRNCPIATTTSNSEDLKFAVTSQAHEVPDGVVFRWHPPSDSRLWATEVSVGKRRRNAVATEIETGTRLPNTKLGRRVCLQPVSLRCKDEPDSFATAITDNEVTNGTRPRPYFGNLHCHSDLSGCRRETQQSLDLNYRWARDLMQQDFHVITDHAEHLSAYDWHSTKVAARFYDFPGYFVGLLGYEWTVNDFGERPHAGHCNVLLRDTEGTCHGSESKETDSLDKLWRKLPSNRAIAIPHHTATFPYLRDWDKHDPDFERLVEVHQDRRGNYEYFGCPGEYGVAAPTQVRETNVAGGYVSDALERGYLLGLCSGGDHMGVSLTGVWAEELTRESLFEALHRRSCYGVTGAHVEMDFSVLDGTGSPKAKMGEVVPIDPTGAVRLGLSVRAPIPMKRLVIVSSGNEVFSSCPESDYSISVRVSLENATKLSYVYARVELADREMAWSSPIWFDEASRM